MSHRFPTAAALALGAALLGSPSLAAQRVDSVAAPHVLARVVVHGSHRGQSRRLSIENARLQSELVRFDARIVTLQLHLDSLKTVADSLDRDRVLFEAARAHARMRRTQIEQRLRELEARTAPLADSAFATP